MGMGCGSMVENLSCVGENSILISAKIKQNQKRVEWGWNVLIVLHTLILTQKQYFV